MNSRQAAKAAAKRIEELEAMVAGQTQDIKDLYAAIHDHISGESLCLWCEEYPECNLNAKMGAGCPEWWLRYRKGPEGGKWPLAEPNRGIPGEESGSEGENHEGEGVFSGSSDSGKGTEADPGEDPAL